MAGPPRPPRGRAGTRQLKLSCGGIHMPVCPLTIDAFVGWSRGALSPLSVETTQQYRCDDVRRRSCQPHGIINMSLNRLAADGVSFHRSASYDIMSGLPRHMPAMHLDIVCRRRFVRLVGSNLARRPRQRRTTRALHERPRVQGTGTPAAVVAEDPSPSHLAGGPIHAADLRRLDRIKSPPGTHGPRGKRR